MIILRSYDTVAITMPEDYWYSVTINKLLIAMSPARSTSMSIIKAYHIGLVSSQKIIIVKSLPEEPDPSACQIK